MSRFGLCRVGLTSQQNLAFYLWFAVVISPIPTPASTPKCGSIKELRKLEWPLSVKVSVNWGVKIQLAHNSPKLR
jgi:hypothetical protein